jgi:hypothetical protein
MRMFNLVIGLAVLAFILIRQVQARPLKSGLPWIITLGVIGLLSTMAFLFGKDQAIAFAKGHSHHLTLAVPNAHAMIIAAAGSLVLAVVMGVVRAPTERLWRETDGQVWRKGTAVTVVLWLVALGLHLGYDAVVAHGPDAQFGDATLNLYFAATIAANRMALHARAARLR